MALLKDTHVDSRPRRGREPARPRPRKLPPFRPKTGMVPKGARDSTALSHRPETGPGSAPSPLRHAVNSAGNGPMSRPGELMRQYAALPYRVDDEDRLNVLLITSRGTGRWVLPKGWADGAETGPQAATREAVEEAGVMGRIAASDALGCYHYFKGLKDGRSVACQVTVFALNVEGFKSDFREKGRRVLRWCSPAYGAQLVHEPELADLLRRFADAGPSGDANHQHSRRMTAATETNPRGA